MKRLLITTLATASALATARGGTAPTEPLPAEAPAADEWAFTLALPGWIAGLEGDVGINGVVSEVNVDPGTIISHIDMVALLRGEASKGRFGITGDFMYLALSESVSPNTIVDKVNLDVDQVIGDIGMRWRLLESEHGFLDVIGGVRYVNLYQRLEVQPNDARILAASSALAAPNADVFGQLARQLASLANNDPTLPIGPLDGREVARLTAAIKQFTGTPAEREAKIAGLLRQRLDRTVSRTDDWFDPYIGLRGRYNFNSRFYATGKCDVGGFGVGSDFTWQAEAAFGYQITQSIYSEIGYRALGIDYDRNGLTYNTITHGAQITLGMKF